MKSKKKKKKITIKDIIRLIVLLIAFSVLLYPTFSSYLNEKNGSKVVSYYDEESVKLSKAKKEQMLEDARAYNKEMLGNIFSSYLNEKNGSKVVSYYDEESVKLSKAKKEQMLEDARAYNKEMLGNIDLIDPFSQEDVEIDARYEGLLNVDGSGMMGYIRIPKINIELPIYHGTSEAVLQAGVGHFWGTSYEGLLNVDGSGMMGYIRIPKINIELPIYHGTSEAVLQAGVGHFWGTSLPVGGESTHTVLTGHRGLPTKTLFTNMDKLEVGDIFYIKVLDETLAYQIDQILTVLPEETDGLSIETKTLFTNMDKLEVGDIFYIKVLDETLAYQIDQILTVLPEETDGLSIESGKDYATLVTCTPFAINTHRLLVRGNTHRLLVRGERIPYEEATKQEPDTNIKPELSFTAKVLIVTIIVIFIGLMIAVIYSIRDRKRRKARCERR